MKAEPHKKQAARTVAIALGVLAGLSAPGAADAVGPTPAPGQIGGQLTEHPTYLIYRPEGWKAEEKYPLVFALSPTGDARSMIAAWSSVADRHHWKTKWIEFSGGHTMASAPVYEAAAAWLEENLPD